MKNKEPDLTEIRRVADLIVREATMPDENFKLARGFVRAVVRMAKLEIALRNLLAAQMYEDDVAEKQAAIAEGRIVLDESP